MKNNWEKLWKEYTCSTNNAFALIHPSLNGTNKFITSYNFDKKSSSTLLRIKSNHGRFPAHLAKLKIIDNDECSCGLGDINHQHSAVLYM